MRRLGRAARQSGSQQVVRHRPTAGRTGLQPLPVECGGQRLLEGLCRGLEVGDADVDEDRDERIRERVVGAGLRLVADVRGLPLVLPDVGAAEDLLRPVDDEAVGVDLDGRQHCRVGGNAAVLVLAVPPRRESAPAHVGLEPDDGGTVAMLMGQEVADRAAHAQPSPRPFSASPVEGAFEMAEAGPSPVTLRQRLRPHVLRPGGRATRPCPASGRRRRATSTATAPS